MFWAGGLRIPLLLVLGRGIANWLGIPAAVASVLDWRKVRVPAGGGGGGGGGGGATLRG